jgi:hypothetical protein
MKTLHTILLTFLLLQSVTVLAQKQDSVTTKSKTRVAIDSTLGVQKVKVKESVKSEVKQTKIAVKEEADRLKLDSAERQQLKKDTKETSAEILDDKVSNLQYDSENPDDAPWKKDQFSKDDLKKFDLPSKEDAKVPSGDGKIDSYKDRASDAKDLSLDKDKLDLDKDKLSGKSSKVGRAISKADSLRDLQQKAESVKDVDDVVAMQRVYSDKYIQHLRDSLGVSKADSLMKLADMAMQVSSKEDLISKLNQPLQEKAGANGLGYNEENQSLTSADATKLQGLPDQYSNMSLDKMQLPQELLSEIAPLKGQLIDSKYMHVIDSMRELYMKAKGYKLDEKQLTEELKKTAMEKKPKFWDKVYFEMVLGFMQGDSSFTIFQVSPSWAYHFTPYLSLGAGPNISVQYAEKKVHGMVGVRTYIKGEFWKHRVYAQVEDSMEPTRINTEAFRSSPHSLLVGGGGVLPFSKKYGINLALFYRVNQQQVRPGGSPWVVRVGLSSIKNTGKK